LLLVVELEVELAYAGAPVDRVPTPACLSDWPGGQQAGRI